MSTCNMDDRTFILSIASKFESTMHVKEVREHVERLNAIAEKLKPDTPAAAWRERGEPDPHGDRYKCKREDLDMGYLTDDELANGAFMNYDVRPPIQDLIAGKAHSPIMWMTAVKDRIRWLSRQLETVRGTPASRGAALMRELEKRFPDPTPFSSSVPPETKYLQALDAALAERPKDLGNDQALIDKCAAYWVERSVMSGGTRLDSPPGNWSWAELLAIIETHLKEQPHGRH